MEQWLIPLLIGLVIGAIAGWLMKGGGYGWIGSLILGLLGSWLGNQVLGGLIPLAGVAGQIVNGVIGACLLVFIFRLVMRRKG